MRRLLAVAFLVTVCFLSAVAMADPGGGGGPGYPGDEPDAVGGPVQLCGPGAGGGPQPD